MKMAKEKKPGVHYIDNKKFYTAIIQYKNDCALADEKGVQTRTGTRRGRCLSGTCPRRCEMLSQICRHR